jgi:hypothetical protein
MPVGKEDKQGAKESTRAQAARIKEIISSHKMNSKIWSCQGGD